MNQSTLTTQPRSKVKTGLLLLVMIFISIAILSAIGGQENAGNYAKLAAALYAILHLLSKQYLPAIILTAVSVL